MDTVLNWEMFDSDAKHIRLDTRGTKWERGTFLFIKSLQQLFIIMFFFYNL